MPPDPNVSVGVMALVYHPYKSNTVVMLRRVGNTGFAADGYDTWTAPGGWIEHGETWKEAAEREVLEEVGMKVYAAQQRGWVICKSEVKNISIVTLFVGCIPADSEQEPHVTEPDKCQDAQWMTWYEVGQKKLFAPLATWLEDHR
jgi:ADP-ribose pyrophosphatase YjhB (NUDIX family)